LLTGKNPSLLLVLVTTMVVVDTAEKVVVWISVVPGRVVVKTLVSTDEMTFVMVLAGSETVTVAFPLVEDVVEDGLLFELDVEPCEVILEPLEVVASVDALEPVLEVSEVDVDESPVVVLDEEVDDSAEVELD
jgi:hypothetical protein